MEQSPGYKFLRPQCFLKPNHESLFRIKQSFHLVKNSKYFKHKLYLNRCHYTQHNDVKNNGLVWDTQHDTDHN
jgi:hypothetical protein